MKIEEISIHSGLNKEKFLLSSTKTNFDKSNSRVDQFTSLVISPTTWDLADLYSGKNL
jgi:hypothetical protein